MQKIGDVAKLIPLYLKGNALVVYLKMGEGDKADDGRVEQRLKTAFAEGGFEAYNKLRKICWTEEPVDVYEIEIID